MITLFEEFNYDRFDKNLSGVFISVRDPEEYYELIS